MENIKDIFNVPKKKGQVILDEVHADYRKLEKDLKELMVNMESFARKGANLDFKSDSMEENNLKIIAQAIRNACLYRIMNSIAQFHEASKEMQNEFEDFMEAIEGSIDKDTINKIMNIAYGK